MDANIQLLMESIELQMWWFQEKKFLFVVLVMLVKDVLKHSEVVEQEFMLLKLILYVLFRPVWRVSKL